MPEKSVVGSIEEDMQAVLFCKKEKEMQKFAGKICNMKKTKFSVKETQEIMLKK